MSTCSACATPSLEIFYSPVGDTLCRPCYSQSQIQAQNERAVASVAASGAPGVPYTTKPATARSQLLNGWISLALCVGTTILSVALVEKIYFWSPIVGFVALRAFARARTLKKERGESTASAIVGLVLGAPLVLGVVLLLIF